MKTKIIFLAAFTLCSAIASYSQTSDAEADAIINLFGVQKKEAMTKLVVVTGKDSAAFWKIYDEYQASNKATAKARILLYENTVRSYGKMTPTIADSLASQYFTNRMDQEKSLEVYYKKVKAATNALIAFQFYQAEVFILTEIRASIMEQIPLYGELQKKK